MRAIARITLAATAVAGFAVLPSIAEAKVQVLVDLDKQTVHVEGPGRSYDWKMSSGKAGYDTPVGKFKVLWMDKDHHSDTYEQAWMPNAIFFAPGYALHGFAKSPWGHKASHGCVRLPSADAAILFDMVKADGGTADITVTGESPVTIETVRAKLAERNAVAAATPPAADRRDVARGYSADGYDPYEDGAQPVYRQPPPPPRQYNLFGLF